MTMKNDHELAMLCNRAYTEATYSANDIEVLVEKYGDNASIAFRSTEFDRRYKDGNILDIIRNIRFLPIYDRRVGWGHAGFLKGARLIVDNYLRDNIDPQSKISIAGHSLGGALAIPAAAMLHFHGFDVRELVTFGAPRVLVKRSHIFKNFRVKQYVYRNDIVPTFIRYLPYRHLNWTQLGGKGSFFSRTWDDHSLTCCYLPALLQENDEV